jgi:hypothetical protein
MARLDVLRLVEWDKTENSIESDLNRKHLTEIPNEIASPPV